MDDYTGYSQVLKAETGAETVYYTRGFELISRRVGQDAHYYLFDGGMSVRALTDETGSVTDTLVFDTFGNEVARTGSSDSPYGFQGEERDATGLYYLRARYMDPSTSTFTSMDTYAGSLSDPISLHKYLFANSNPVKYCDPSGHMSLVESMAVGAIIGALAAADYYMISLCNNFDDGARFNPWSFSMHILRGALLGAFIAFVIYDLVQIVLAFVEFVTIYEDKVESLYRAMSQAEYESMVNNNGFVPSPGYALERKWFATSVEGVQRFAEELSRLSGDYEANIIVVRVDVLSESLSRMYYNPSQDGIAEAYCASVELLNEVWQFFERVT